MRAYAPQLTYAQAEECLTSTAKSGSVDIAAAFDACGLSQIVEEGKAAEQAASAESKKGTLDPSPTTSDNIPKCCGCGCLLESRDAGLLSEPGTSGFESKTTCPRPRIMGIANHLGHLFLHVHGRPEGCRLQARLWVRRITCIAGVLRPSVLRRCYASQAPVSTAWRRASRRRMASRTSSQWVSAHKASTADSVGRYAAFVVPPSTYVAICQGREGSGTLALWACDSSGYRFLLVRS